MSESQESEANQYQVVLLSDAPAEEDEFGSHQRVADAIAELIINEQEGGKAIALEGSWGSGKSTILRLIRIALKNQVQKTNSKVELVIFDAWSHQDDPLRRSFLERLIERLQQLDWVDQEPWQNKREELAKRHREETKTNIPKLAKPGGTSMAVSFLLVPLGLLLLGSALDRIPSPSIWAIVLGLIGYIFSVAPLVVYGWITRPSKGKHLDKEEREKRAAILLNQQIVTTTSITDETPDPTSIEFETTFDALMDAALDEPLDRKLVIALDNLDRISPNEALSILSTLQVFLKPSQVSDKHWFKRLWVIVPYDSRSLKNLWTSKNGGDNRELSFVEKLFQIRFEVPPLPLSDWQRYLVDLLGKAFLQHGNIEDFHHVCRVYDMYGKFKRQVPTPRELKLFVNQIGTIYRQWGKTFPLAQQAFYVLQRKYGGNVVLSLQNPDYIQPGDKRVLIDSRTERVVGKDIRDNLAAMAFNTEVSVAHQLLLREPLKDALANGDRDELKKLSENYRVGFWEVLEQIDFHDWLDKQENYKIALAANALASIDADPQDRNAFRNRTAKRLIEVAKECGTWWPLNSQVAEGLVALIEFGLDTSLPKQVAGAISATNMEDDEDINNAELASALIAIVHAFVANDITNVLGNGISIQATPEKTVPLFAHIHDRKLEKKYWKYLKPAASANKIKETLVEIIKRHGTRELHYKAIKYLTTTEYLITTPLLKDIFDSVGEVIQSANQEQELRSLIRILLLRKRQQLAPPNPVGFNQAYGLLEKAKNMKSARAIALTLFFLLDKYADLPNPGDETATAGHHYLIQELFQQPGQHSDILDELIVLVEEYEHKELVWELYRKRPGMSKEWVAAYLRKIIDRQMVEALLRDDTIFEQWDFVRNTLEQKYRYSLFEQLLRDDTGLLVYIQSNITGFEIEKADLYAELIDAGAEKNEEFCKWCQTGLQNLEEEKWNSELNNVSTSTTLPLLFAILETPCKTNLGIAFLDALLEHAANLMKGAVKVSPYHEKWPRLLEAFENEDNKGILCQRLLLKVRDATKADIVISQDFFAAYGPMMIESPDAVQGTSEIIASLFIPLLDQDNSAGIKWMADLFERHPDLLQKCGPDNMVKHFEDKIRARLTENEENESSEIEQLIEQLAEILNIAV